MNLRADPIVHRVRSHELAEQEYVTYDKYRADLADFRADMARFREEIRVDLANLELRLVRWLLVAAVIGGLVGGLIAAVSQLFA